ncbi:MAG: GNAT family N-acetyltransferase [Balneolales bacterium]
MTDIEVVKANLYDPLHTEALLHICDEYARDPMGMNESLSEAVKIRLIDQLRNFPTTISFLAFLGGQPVGMANGFYGFSTFNGKRLINIHDLAVLPPARGKGAGEALLKAVEKQARLMDCCKVTLEVREDNRARRLYERFGFRYGDPGMLFMSKELGDPHS